MEERPLECCAAPDPVPPFWTTINSGGKPKGRKVTREDVRAKWKRVQKRRARRKANK